MKEGESKKTALVLMKNSHFDRTPQYTFAKIYRGPKKFRVKILWFKRINSMFNGKNLQFLPEICKKVPDFLV